MFDRYEEGHFGGSNPLWRRTTPFETSSLARKRLLDRLGSDLHAVMQNEVETRHFLAHEVYRVPEIWLDDVLRVRLADLER